MRYCKGVAQRPKPPSAICPVSCYQSFEQASTLAKSGGRFSESVRFAKVVPAVCPVASYQSQITTLSAAGGGRISDAPRPCVEPSKSQWARGPQVPKPDPRPWRIPVPAWREGLKSFNRSIDPPSPPAHRSAPPPPHHQAPKPVVTVTAAGTSQQELPQPPSPQEQLQRQQPQAEAVAAAEALAASAVAAAEAVLAAHTVAREAVARAAAAAEAAAASPEDEMLRAFAAAAAAPMRCTVRIGCGPRAVFAVHRWVDGVLHAN